MTSSAPCLHALSPTALLSWGLQCFVVEQHPYSLHLAKSMDTGISHGKQTRTAGQPQCQECEQMHQRGPVRVSHCALPRCAVLCCAVLCCAVLCCAVLCCVAVSPYRAPRDDRVSGPRDDEAQ
jgi:hypothetical protein